MADQFCSGYPDPPPPLNPLENICACALTEVDRLVEDEIQRRLHQGISCPPCDLEVGQHADSPLYDPCDENYTPPPHKCIPSMKDKTHLVPCAEVRKTILKNRRGSRADGDNALATSLKAAEQALAVHYGETPNAQDLIHDMAFTVRPGVTRLKPADIFVHGATRDRIRAEISFEDEQWGEFFAKLAAARTIPAIITFLEQLDEDVRAHEVLKYVSGRSYLRQEMQLIDKFADAVNEKFFVALRNLEDTSTDPSVVAQFDGYEVSRKEWLHKLRQQRELDEMLTYQLNRLTPIQGIKTEAYFKKLKAGKKMMATANKSKDAVQMKACRADRLQEFVQLTFKTVDDVVRCWGQLGSDSDPPTGASVILEAMIRNVTKKPSDIYSDLKAVFQTRRVPMFRNIQTFICTVLNQTEQLTASLKELHTILLGTMDQNSKVPRSFGDGGLCEAFSKQYYADNDPAMSVFNRVQSMRCGDHPDF